MLVIIFICFLTIALSRVIFESDFIYCYIVKSYLQFEKCEFRQNVDKVIKPGKKFQLDFVSL